MKYQSYKTQSLVNFWNIHFCDKLERSVMKKCICSKLPNSIAFHCKITGQTVSLWVVGSLSKTNNICFFKEEMKFQKKKKLEIVKKFKKMLKVKKIRCIHVATRFTRRHEKLKKLFVKKKEDDTFKERLKDQKYKKCKRRKVFATWKPQI